MIHFYNKMKWIRLVLDDMYLMLDTRVPVLKTEIHYLPIT